MDHVHKPPRGIFKIKFIIIIKFYIQNIIFIYSNPQFFFKENNISYIIMRIFENSSLLA